MQASMHGISLLTHLCWLEREQFFEGVQWFTPQRWSTWLGSRWSVNRAQSLIAADNQVSLGGGFKYFVFSPRNPGEMIQFDEHIFQMGWFNHQPESSFIMRIGIGFWGADGCTRYGPHMNTFHSQPLLFFGAHEGWYIICTMLWSFGSIMTSIWAKNAPGSEGHVLAATDRCLVLSHDLLDKGEVDDGMMHAKEMMVWNQLFFCLRVVKDDHGLGYLL